MNFPDLFSTQFSANYQGPQVIPQGEIRPVFNLNLGLRLKVLNQRSTVSVNISDVLNTCRFSLQTEGADFYQERSFKNESRVGTLTFTWRFRGYAERSRERTDNGINPDVEGLFGVDYQILISKF
jgi:iron complex outermembrane recepter protein